MSFNPFVAYTNELTRIFINALISDNDSEYFKSTTIEVLEAILNNNLEFSIDENNVIWEKSGSNEPTEIFKNNKKNAEAIYCLKILTSNNDIVEEEIKP